jgi:hypothetical protein
MTPGDFLTGFIMLVTGYILFISVMEYTEDYRERKRIYKDWEKMKSKELDHE